MDLDPPQIPTSGPSSAPNTTAPAGLAKKRRLSSTTEASADPGELSPAPPPKKKKAASPRKKKEPEAASPDLFAYGATAGPPIPAVEEAVAGMVTTASPVKKKVPPGPAAGRKQRAQVEQLPSPSNKWKTKFLELRSTFDTVSAIQTQRQAALKEDRAELARLQAENNMLIDAIMKLRPDLIDITSISAAVLPPQASPSQDIHPMSAPPVEA